MRNKNSKYMASGAFVYVIVSSTEKFYEERKWENENLVKIDDGF